MPTTKQSNVFIYFTRNYTVRVSCIIACFFKHLSLIISMCMQGKEKTLLKSWYQKPVCRIFITTKTTDEPLVKEYLNAVLRLFLFKCFSLWSPLFVTWHQLKRKIAFTLSCINRWWGKKCVHYYTSVYKNELIATRAVQYKMRLCS